MTEPNGGDRKEAQGRLILEASTGMHGDVAKQLAQALCAALDSKPLASADPEGHRQAIADHKAEQAEAPKSCGQCGGSGEVYSLDGEGPWRCYVCTQPTASSAGEQS